MPLTRSLPRGSLNARAAFSGELTTSSSDTYVPLWLCLVAKAAREANMSGARVSLELGQRQLDIAQASAEPRFEPKTLYMYKMLLS